MTRPPPPASRRSRPSPRTAQTRAAREPARAPAEPRRVPARRAEPAYAAAGTAPERRERSGRGFRRMMAFLALIAVLALVVIAAVVISNSTSNTVVHYKKIVAHDASRRSRRSRT